MQSKRCIMLGADFVGPSCTFKPAIPIWWNSGIHACGTAYLGLLRERQLVHFLSPSSSIITNASLAKRCNSVYCDKMAAAIITQFLLKKVAKCLLARYARPRNSKGSPWSGIGRPQNGVVFDFLRGAISRKPCEIELRSQLIANHIRAFDLSKGRWPRTIFNS